MSTLIVDVQTPIHTCQVLFTAGVEEELEPHVGNSSLFGIHPTSATYAQAVVAFVREFGWQRFSVLTEGGDFFNSVRCDLKLLEET